MSAVGTSFGSGNLWETFQYRAVPAAPGSETLWLAAATNIWTVLIATMAEPGSTSEWETSSSCLRPDTFKEGTLRPSKEPKGTEPVDGTPTTTGTTGGPTASPTNAASQADLTVAAAAVGLVFNAAILLM
ncbi:hypothetical protein DHEL01_v212187 [Diaporthe helianthi]|uniref:Uncharacterized protein n=1 Tax=Diaporthe helianthi TaxID=158607 RepID=A0A2P5HGQ2_DIAHE|nr:hypothetical protein DHEL01_v212187 [Diaporthe helianthi]